MDFKNNKDKEIDEFSNFYQEFMDIINEFSKNNESFYLHKIYSIFRELGVTEDIKKKLVTFAVGMCEISRINGMGFAKEQNEFRYLDGNDKKH